MPKVISQGLNPEIVALANMLIRNPAQFSVSTGGLRESTGWTEEGVGGGGGPVCLPFPVQAQASLRHSGPLGLRLRAWAPGETRSHMTSS